MSRGGPAKKRARARGDAATRIGPIVRRLERRHPDATTALRHRNPIELLVATILSAQCTDERVNKVTETLFEKYRTAREYANADPDEFQEEIKSTGFYRNKTKSILSMARALVENHGGEVPDRMEDLVKLPGVGRKTANVVLGSAFGINEGVVVDTHVARVARRLALTAHTDPVKIERDLMELVPRRSWARFAHLLIFHGRRICHARRPQCETCPVNSLCPAAPV